MENFKKILELDAEFLAKRNNGFCRFLNKKINACHIACFIPKSTHIEHSGCGTIIGAGAKIGENVVIFHNVTLGRKNQVLLEKDGYPEIGDNVIIYSGSILLGKIRIGKNSIIGAGSFVDRDIPANSVVYTKKELVIEKRETKNGKK